MTACMPQPAISSTVSGRVTVIPFPCAAETILCAMGWVEVDSQAAQSSSRVSAFTESAGRTVCRTKLPSVRVPVLSIITAFTLRMASREIPPLNRMPRLEPAPIPEKNARGTLKTRAQGQLITRKVSAVYTQWFQSPVIRDGMTAVASARNTTKGCVYPCKSV